MAYPGTDSNKPQRTPYSFWQFLIRTVVLPQAAALDPPDWGCDWVPALVCNKLFDFQLAFCLSFLFPGRPFGKGIRTLVRKWVCAEHLWDFRNVTQIFSMDWFWKIHIQTFPFWYCVLLNPYKAGKGILWAEVVFQPQLSANTGATERTLLV